MNGYTALLIMPPDGDDQKTLIEGVRLLERRIDGNNRVFEIGGAVRLVHEGWNVDFRVAVGEHVVEEAKEMADRYASDRPDKEKIALSSARVEIDTDPDPDMNMFNVYVLCVECLSDYFGAIPFDSLSGEFM